MHVPALPSRGSAGHRSPGRGDTPAIPTVPSPRLIFFLPFSPTRFSLPLSSFPSPLASFLPHFPFLPPFLAPGRFSSPALNNAERQRSPAALLYPDYPLYSRLSTNFGSGRRSQGGQGMAVGPQHGNCLNSALDGCHGHPKIHFHLCGENTDYINNPKSSWDFFFCASSGNVEYQKLTPRGIEKEKIEHFPSCSRAG